MTGRSAVHLVFVFGVAARTLFAVSYVVPTDRFEIERSSAIIVGRVLSSHVERSPQFGIETVTEVVLEQGLKGNVGTVVQIHEPGGVLGDEARLIPGVPDFTDGDRVLLFLYQRRNGRAGSIAALGAPAMTPAGCKIVESGMSNSGRADRL